MADAGWGGGRDQWQVLAFAALVVLALNPFAVFDVGFQLSFAAFVGMLALVGPLERLLHRASRCGPRRTWPCRWPPRWGRRRSRCSSSAGRRLISPLANLLVVPTLPAVTGLGMASVLLGFVWSGLQRRARHPGLAAHDRGPSWCRRSVRAVAGPGRRRPGPGRCSRRPRRAAALPAALALSGRAVSPPLGLRLPAVRALGRLAAGAPAARPAAGRRAGRRRRCLPRWCWAPRAYPAAAAGLRSAELLAGGKGWPAQVEVRVLDVGQGNAVLVRTPEHHALLFDGGPAGCDLAGQLRALGVRRLDLVVISHPHADHFAGLLEALDSLEVGTFVDQTRGGRPATARRRRRPRRDAG